jgi:hypothetical protein
MNDAAALADLLFAALEQRPDAYLAGLAGIPWSGKTRLCRTISTRRPEVVVVPMDGFNGPTVPATPRTAEPARRRRI